MEDHLQTYLQYFLDTRRGYSAIDFFKKYGFNYRDKETAHLILSKCLEYLRSSSKPELQTISANVMKALENKKYLNAFWASKKSEEKKDNLEKRMQIAEKKSKLYDVEQHATVKKLVYKQDNNVRENFSAEILKKRDSIQDIEKEQPSIPKSRKRKRKDLLENKNGEKVKEILVRMTSKTIEQAKEIQSKGKKLEASTLSTIRLGLNIEPKKFESVIENDINKIEELCSEYKYWEARDFVYEKLKGRPDKTRTLQHQVMKIYFFIIEMFLVDPYIFVDREGNKQNLTEIEFVLKVAGPTIDIIFSDVQHLVQLKWGETVSKATAVGRKIDLQVTCRRKNRGKIVELSHSECARRTTPTKIINDRSKCLRTNKFVLDQYLSHDLSDEITENSAVIGLQLAALYGQIIGVDLLDNGLYFGFEGPLLRFPTQINDITVLKQTLEALYFFKEASSTKDILQSSTCPELPKNPQPPTRSAISPEIRSDSGISSISPSIEDHSTDSVSLEQISDNTPEKLENTPDNTSNSDDHDCPSAPQGDGVRVPTCPLCNVPVPINKGEDPNLRVTWNDILQMTVDHHQKPHQQNPSIPAHFKIVNNVLLYDYCVPDAARTIVLNID
ncbi:1347_t:CDS:10 [Ambispora gerdemannii]|uniref:1347_t:CDS:1 n=1 Tax=Ambispora gerdemannii TaxID=144530 RepID=A0A9N9ACM1_9GLOM|nr:1347_t:CDS:10 [Ambispora gerdemannii]